MDGFCDAVEGRLAVGPAKQVIAFGGLSAARFNEGQAREQTPVEAVSVGFRHEYIGVFLIGAMLFLQKLAENCPAQVKLFAVFRDVLAGICGRSGDSEHSREKNQTGWQKALHITSFSLSEFQVERPLWSGRRVDRVRG